MVTGTMCCTCAPASKGRRHRYLALDLWPQGVESYLGMHPRFCMCISACGRHHCAHRSRLSAPTLIYSEWPAIASVAVGLIHTPHVAGMVR